MFFLFLTASEYFSLLLLNCRFILSFLCIYLRSHLIPFLLHVNFNFVSFLEILYPSSFISFISSKPFFFISFSHTAASPDPEGKFVVLTHLYQKVKTRSPLVLLGLCDFGIWIVGHICTLVRVSGYHFKLNQRVTYTKFWNTVRENKESTRITLTFVAGLL